MSSTANPIVSMCLLLASVGCAATEHRPARPVPGQQGFAGPVAGNGLPTTPPAWTWPFDPRNVATVFARPINVRPIDLSRLVPAAGSHPCAPAQVAPFVWVAPDCTSAMTNPLAASPFVPRRPIVARLNESLPNEVDLRRSGLDGPVKYQQMVGICWAFAMSTVMENALRRAGNPDVVAPLHVVSSKVWDEIWKKGRSDRDLTLEASWPYDPVKGCKLNEAKSEVWCGEAYHVKPGSWRSDPALVSEIERANANGAHRIARVETLRVKPANTDQIAGVLASGQSVFASFDYNEEVWGTARTPGPVIPDYAETHGAHAVVIAGYRSVAGSRQFLVHNSWGPEWREGGYAWISDAMVRVHVRDAFTVEVAQAQGSRAPQPGPQPMPGPRPQPGAAQAGCPSGQVRDTVFGWCAPVCAGGAPPAAMFCTGSTTTGPTRPSTSSCAAGQLRDWLTGACAAQCRNGLPSVGGVCL